MDSECNEKKILKQNKMALGHCFVSYAYLLKFLSKFLKRSNFYHSKRKNHIIGASMIVFYIKQTVRAKSQINLYC